IKAPGGAKAWFWPWPARGVYNGQRPRALRRHCASRSAGAILLEVCVTRSIVLAFVALFAASAVASAGGEPNVVMIISDEHAWTAYSFMRHPWLRTPNIDRLAREGRTFRRGYVTSSLCCPSLASIITGLYPHQHKITSNDPPLPGGMNSQDFQRSAAFQA